MKFLGMTFFGDRMRLAGIYIFRDRMISSVEYQTVDGIWKMQRAFLVDGADDPMAVGMAVKQALSASRQGIPAPDRSTLNSDTDPVLELSGVKSRSTFMKSAKSVVITEEGRTSVVTPLANQGMRGGFQSLEDKARTLTTPGESELGAAVLAAFADIE
jgi:hypothetical protein